MNLKLALGGATFYVTFIFQKNYKVKWAIYAFFCGKIYKYKFTHSSPKWVIVPWWGHVTNYDKCQFDK
jgi:hypothetical protein